ncbi:hypothetical protein [Streptomyces sp. NPDC096132]|uniref:hypothetical protein n=1 Tax=Streptomyces sp. NPDC096132 TaxID=3366075 RepID=UPI0037FAA71B
MGSETDSTEQVHAYGRAGDVPAVLRAMESTDARVRDTAMAWLGSLLCHRDNARTSPAAPQLARLALTGPGHRAELLDLLGDLARWAGPSDERERCRRALVAAMPSLLPLADDADPAVREEIALLIAACGPEDGGSLTPVLRDRLAVETEPGVRARIVTALGLLETGDGAWRHGLLTDPEPRVVLAAAEDLLRTAEPPLPDVLVDAGARAYATEPQEPEGFRWPSAYVPFTDRLLAYPEAALRALAGGVPLAFAIAERWRDRETDVFPWVLGEASGEFPELSRLAQLTCSLPPELHPHVRDHVLPHLAADSPETRAAAVTVLARARVSTAVEEAVRLVEEAAGAYATVRAVRAVAEEFGPGALPVARAVARRSGDVHCDLVKVLTGFPEVAVDVVEELAGLLTRHGTGYPPVAVAVLGSLGRAAGEVGERALRVCFLENVHSSVTAEAAVALWPVAADPEPALSLLRRELSGGMSSWATNLAGRLGPAAAPLLPLVEPLLAPGMPRGVRASAALAVWRIVGRTEDTVEPLAREAIEWKRCYPGTPHALMTLGEMGLVPRFAVDPLRQGAEAPQRLIRDLMYGDALHPDYVVRNAARDLLSTARVID